MRQVEEENFNNLSIEEIKSLITKGLKGLKADRISAREIFNRFEDKFENDLEFVKSVITEGLKGLEADRINAREIFNRFQDKFANDDLEFVKFVITEGLKGLPSDKTSTREIFNRFQDKFANDDLEFVKFIITAGLKSYGVYRENAKEVFNRFQDKFENDLEFVKFVITEGLKGLEADRIYAREIFNRFQDKFENDLGFVKFVITEGLKGLEADRIKAREIFNRFQDKLENDLEGITDILSNVLSRDVDMAMSINQSLKKKPAESKFTKYPTMEEMLKGLIKCDEKTFKCDNLISGILKYIPLAEPEVQDLFQISLELEWPFSTSIEVSYSPTGKRVGGYSSNKGVIKLFKYTEFNQDFLGSLIHELKHLINDVVYQNDSNPYTIGINNQKHYEANVFHKVMSHVPPFYFGSFINFLECRLFNKVENCIAERLVSMKEDYIENDYHLELDVRLYQFLVNYSDKFEGTNYYSADALEIVRSTMSPISHKKFMEDACKNINICLVEENTLASHQQVSYETTCSEFV